MQLSDLLPPSDLLEKVQGIEAGLRQRRMLGRIATAGLLISSTVELVLEASKSGIAKAVQDGELAKHWVVLVPIALAVLFFLFSSWARFWLRESRRPFRYTCSIAAFEPGGVIPPDAEPIARTMSWLQHDLARLLNERVHRFMFKEQADTTAKADGSKQAAASRDADSIPADSHVHIHGRYILRETRAPNAPGLEIEVLPAVRIGSTTSPELLAIPTPPIPVQVGSDRKLMVKRDCYDSDILERAYHSVVSEIYRQLKDDVERKIGLLPTSRLRVIALLNEADDYVRSNTLNGYEQARDLYRRAASIFDPSLRPVPDGGLPRWLWRLRCRVARLTLMARRRVAVAYPALAERDVLCARALVGYALMLVIRRPLAMYSGARENALYEARPVLQKALARLQPLPVDVPGFEAASFEADVVHALWAAYNNDYDTARSALQRAEAARPQVAETHGLFLYAKSQAETNQITRLSLLQRVIEIDPRFEIARFQFAGDAEAIWRSRDRFEREGAKMVIAEYDHLLLINPANLAAWANSGYVCWLNEDLDGAIQRFQSGIALKRLKGDLFVSELEYGLARAYAECGDIAQAYTFYISAISELLAHDSLISFRPYYHSPSNLALAERFRTYFRNFVTRPSGWWEPTKDHADLQRMRRSVHAFVANDVGEALRSTDGEMAVLMFQHALAANPEFALPRFNLGAFKLEAGDPEGIELMTEAVDRHPLWVEARLELAKWCISEAPKQTSRAQAEIQELTAQRAQDEHDPQDEAEKHLERSTRIAKLQTTLRDLQVQQSRLDKRARTIIREHLPHDALWRGGEIDEELLWDPDHASVMYWERALSDVHMIALALWAVRLASDPTQRQRAVRVLEHLRTYTPSMNLLCIELYRLNKQTLDEARAALEQLDGGDLWAQVAATHRLGEAESALRGSVRSILSACPEYLEWMDPLDELGFPWREERQWCDLAMRRLPRAERGWATQRFAEACARAAGNQADPTPEALALRQEAANLDPRRAAELSRFLETTRHDLAGALRAAEIASHAGGNRRQGRRVAELKARLALQQTADEYEPSFGTLWLMQQEPARAISISHGAALGPAMARFADAANEERDRLRKETGFMFPEIAVVADAPDHGARDASGRVAYTIKIRNCPVASGSVDIEPASAGVDVDAASLATAQTIARHAVAIMVANIGEFVDIDSVLQLIRGARRRRALRPDDVQRAAQLAPVLRVLLAERFPVKELRRISAITNDCRTAGMSLSDTVESIRRDPDLRGSNPFVHAPHKLVRVGPNLERSCRTAAIDPATRGLIRARALAVRESEPQAVLLSSADVRFAMRELVAPLPLVSDLEALPEGMPRILGEVFDVPEAI